MCQIIDVLLIKDNILLIFCERRRRNQERMSSILLAWKKWNLGETFWNSMEFLPLHFEAENHHACIMLMSWWDDRVGADCLLLVSPKVVTKTYSKHLIEENKYCLSKESVDNVNAVSCHCTMLCFWSGLKRECRQKWSLICSKHLSASWSSEPLHRHWGKSFCYKVLKKYVCFKMRSE